MSLSSTHTVFASVAIVAHGRLLLVQEAKPQMRGKWNLPGGHVEPPEDLRSAAAREVLEETGLDVVPGPLLRIFTGPNWIRFVFHAEASHDGAIAGDQIMAVRALTRAELDAIPDAELEHVGMMRSLFTSLQTDGALAGLLVEGVRRSGDPS
jgi:ADP-ribose pyrophosphatase YjhB (NUDIX family)